ncbi:MAG: hypothetical protein LBR70_02815 [Lactobacillaceae bacterium]|jgi:hypothetical protein|nr:hypothetical protein [Lactobacillaceae bacterium]
MNAFSEFIVNFLGYGSTILAFFFFAALAFVSKDSAEKVNKLTDETSM